MKKTWLLLVALVLAGCSQGLHESSQAKEFLDKDPKARKAVEAVLDYNRLLVDVYRKNDITLIRPLVVDREYNKLHHLVEGLQAQSLLMEAELRGMEIEHAERWGEGTVVVKTRELWHYRRVNSQSGVVVKPPTDLEYRMEYRMVFQDGRWQLFSLAPL